MNLAQLTAVLFSGCLKLHGPIDERMTLAFQTASIFGILSYPVQDGSLDFFLCSLSPAVENHISLAFVTYQHSLRACLSISCQLCYLCPA